MAEYAQLKASTCLVAINKVLFNYILSSLTKPDPCLIESNCANLVPDKPLLKNKKTPYLSKYPSFPGVSDTQGTKAPKAHDAVSVFCEHPLRILNTKTIKFWYNERQLVSVPKG